MVRWQAISKPVAARIQGRHPRMRQNKRWRDKPVTNLPHQLVFLVGGLVVGCDVGGLVVGCDVVGCEVFRAGAMIQPWSKIPRPSGCGFLSSFDSAIPYKTLELSVLLIISSASSLVE
jgi:hypothetical protein